MRFVKISLLSIAVVLILSGCATNEALRKSNQDVLYQVDTKNKESARNLEEQTLRVNATIDSLNERNTALESRVALLERKVDELQRMNGVSMQKWEQEKAQLSKLLASEQQARQASINKMAEQVAKETATAINTLSTQQQAAMKQQQQLMQQRQQQAAKEAKDAKEAAATTGSFYEYKVQAGATLNTIAKAYGVSVAEIKAANKMKGDTVKVGQKLLIPKK